jgi:hypothetical protein
MAEESGAVGPYIRRWIFHLVLPYPEFVRAAFMSHASTAAQLVHRAMSPLFGRLMRRQMDINPASAEIARAKTLAAMDRLAEQVRPSGYLVAERATCRFPGLSLYLRSCGTRA